jgi:hypothetical protein
MLDWLDSLFGAKQSKRNVKALKQNEGTHTFLMSAPLCSPIRRIYTGLYARGVRPTHWQWMDVQDKHPKTEELVTVGQMLTLTVSNKQANWTEYLLRHLQQQDREGFEIHSKTIDVRNQFHARRRNGKMPTPWIAQGCKPRQR